jgi:hypothetical protein
MTKCICGGLFSRTQRAASLVVIVLLASVVIASCGRAGGSGPKAGTDGAIVPKAGPGTPTNAPPAKPPK